MTSEMAPVYSVRCTDPRCLYASVRTGDHATAQRLARRHAADQTHVVRVHELAERVVDIIGPPEVTRRC
jgi:hypothetical protein